MANMSRQEDNEQFSLQNRFSNMALTEANETLINEEGRPAQSSTNVAAIAEGDACQRQSPDTVYIIRTPTALQRFLNTQPLSSIRIIRLVLLHPLESVKLIEEEKYGFWGPNVDPLCDAWRTAFRSIPHTIELIVVDISHSFSFESRTFIRLVQHPSTTVYMRSGKRARFEVRGARTVAGKAFIEDSMVGLKEGSAENWEQERLVIGAD